MSVRKAASWLCLVLLAFALGALGKAGFREWREKRMASAARAFVLKGDFLSASLTAQQVLQTNPSNLEMSLLLAQIADAAGSEQSIPLWEHVVQLEKGSLGAVGSLVNAALRFEEPMMAAEAVGQVRAGDRNTSGFHQLKGAVALASRQMDLADAEFSEAARLDPQNGQIQLNLASIRIQSSKPEIAATAAASLEQLALNSTLRSAAVRVLLADARKRGDFPDALRRARELADTPGASFQDRLVLAESLEKIASPEFTKEFDALKIAASANPEQGCTWIRWMNARGMASLALQWVETQPPAFRALIPVQMAVGDSLIALKRWEELRGLGRGKNWGGSDFLRLAFEARAARELAMEKEAVDKWNAAIKATSGDVRSLRRLGLTADGWGWSHEAERVWWLITQHTVGRRAALRSLFNLYMRDKNTPQLYEVTAMMHQSDPQDIVSSNNLAVFSLLLGKDLVQARRIAIENYRKYPSNSGIASTYALSLYLNQQTGEALKILEALPEEALRQPSVAACFGAILSASGDPKKARPFLDIAARNGELLPEERALAKNARRP